MFHMAEEPFLGFLPSWIGDLSSVLGLPAIVLAVIVFLLNRRGANRRLVVEEGTLKKSEFESFTVAQNTALEGARKEIKEAKDEADYVSDRLDVMDELYDQMRESIMWLRSYVRKITSRSSYVMSVEEQAEFEMTKPPARPPRRRV